MSIFAHVEEAPADPILGITQNFNADTDPRKVNLGVGAYRTEEGKPWVLPSVRKAEQDIVNSNKYNKEYIPIDGIPEFTKAASELLLGVDSPALKEKRVAVVQSISGTGALRLGGEFIHKFFSGASIYISDPTWGNHQNIFRHANVAYKNYRYFNPANNGLNFDGMIEDLKGASEGSFVLLHACAHNPTGVDPSKEQWQTIAEVIRSRKLIPFFDCAYQGFASGSLEEDAYAVRYFVSQGFEILIAQSFAKNMGLYGERVGAFYVVSKSEKEAKTVLSQVKVIVRSIYSSPPIHGARVAATILSTPELYEQWKVELKSMADRIIEMRRRLFDAIVANQTPGTWNHIIDQIGMFSYTGLKPENVEVLIKKYHIHLLSNGRISMAGLNSSNVQYLADAIHDALTGSAKL